MSQSQVILIDDDLHLREASGQTLDLAGFTVETRASAEGLTEALGADWPGVVVSDIRMPGMDGLALLEALTARDPDQPVILITGHGDVPLAVKAMRAGAYDFLEKPFAADALVDVVRRALEKRRLVLDNRSLRLALDDRSRVEARVLGRSAPMQRLRAQVESVAATSADVLLHGETGTGKEVIARTLHDFSPRREGPFVAINCGALMESVAESELFGHEAGAFTGAQKRRIGKFEYANGGTVFLDEIESMSMDMQVKLLRLLQERTLERLGGNQLIRLDIRVVAATKTDLRKAADAGQFRLDLYYRLNVITLRIPALRERGDDALLLFEQFVATAAQRHGMAPRRLGPQQVAAIAAHDWPGNVRELQNAAERYALGLELELPTLAPSAGQMSGGGLVERVDAYERALIVEALSGVRGSVSAAAEALGVPRKTLHDKLRRHGLSRQAFVDGNPPPESVQSGEKPPPSRTQ